MIKTDPLKKEKEHFSRVNKRRKLVKLNKTMYGKKYKMTNAKYQELDDDMINKLRECQKESFKNKQEFRDMINMIDHEDITSEMILSASSKLRRLMVTIVHEQEKAR